MLECCPEREGYPPSCVNFSESLHEEKADPFTRAKSGFSVFVKNIVKTGLKRQCSWTISVKRFNLNN